jgi:hypothetical protein
MQRSISKQSVVLLYDNMLTRIDVCLLFTNADPASRDLVDWFLPVAVQHARTMPA